MQVEEMLPQFPIKEFHPVGRAPHHGLEVVLYDKLGSNPKDYI
jgi:hypothetical protein